MNTSCPVDLGNKGYCSQINQSRGIAIPCGECYNTQRDWERNFRSNMKNGGVGYDYELSRPFGNPTETSLRLSGS